MDNDAKTKIKIVQVMYGKCNYFAWSEKINRLYCDRHGYEYVVSRETPRKDRHGNWHKVPVVLSELNHCDYLLYVDADAIFYGHEFKIEEELLPVFEDSKLLLMNQDIGCENARWNPGLPSAGVFLARTCPATSEIMEVWDEASNADESARWDWPLEQKAFWNVVLPKFRERAQILDDYYLLQGRYGMYIRHFFQSSDKDREAAMRQFCARRGIA
ncbi:MAG: hypothetical protein FWH27_18925 [Planctomycetaceae bacterium]|nr:hypothetical protein [Planctomycetaceae bacterium]